MNRNFSKTLLIILETVKEKIKSLALMMTHIAEYKYRIPGKNWKELNMEEKLDTHWFLCFIDDCHNDTILASDKLLTKDEISNHLSKCHFTSIEDISIQIFSVVIAHEEEGSFSPYQSKTKNKIQIDCFITLIFCILFQTDLSPLREKTQKWLRKEYQKRYICLLSACKEDKRLHRYSPDKWLEHFNPPKHDREMLKGAIFLSLNTMYKKDERLKPSTGNHKNLRKKYAVAYIGA